MLNDGLQKIEANAPFKWDICESLSRNTTSKPRRTKWLPATSDLSKRSEQEGMVKFPASQTLAVFSCRPECGTETFRWLRNWSRQSHHGRLALFSSYSRGTGGVWGSEGCYWIPTCAFQRGLRSWQMQKGKGSFTSKFLILKSKGELCRLFTRYTERRLGS